MSTTPKRLTVEEIDYIVNDLPLIRGRGLSARKMAHADNLRLLRIQLSTVEIYPEILGEFKAFIHNEWIGRSVESWAPIGILSSMAVSSPITQSTLNSFHAAGAESGISNRFADLAGNFTATNTNKDMRNMIVPQSRIMDTLPHDLHYSKHLNDSKAVYAEYRGIIEETTMKNIRVDYTYITGNNATFRTTYENYQQKIPASYNDGRILLLNTILKVDLDLQRMFTHKILLGDVIEAMDSLRDQLDVTFIWGPTYTSCFYVVAFMRDTPGAHLDMYATSRDVTALNRFVNQMERGIHIKGIPNITNMRTDTMPVSTILGEYAIDADDPLTHRLYILSTGTRQTGISMMDVAFAVKYVRETRTDEHTWADMGITSFADVEYAIVSGGHLYEILQQYPDDYLYEVYDYGRYIIRGDISRIDPMMIQAVFIRNPDIRDIEIDSDNMCLIFKVSRPNVNVGEMVREMTSIDGFAVRVVARGPFAGIMEQDDFMLDYTRTYPIFHHSINDLLGIQNTAVFMINYTYQNIVNGGQTVNIGHLETMISYMAMEGDLIPMNFYGVRRMNDPLTAASHERALEVIATASLEGKLIMADKVSTAIYVGKRIPQGTGAVNVVHGDYNNFVADANVYDFTFDETEAGTNYSGVPVYETEIVGLNKAAADIDLPDEQIKLYAGYSGAYDPDFNLDF